jgi:hypothetical protein
MSDTPRILKTSVNYSGGGKVAIKDFGKISSDYYAAITRQWQVPADWTEDQVAVFELEQIEALREQLDPVLQSEFDMRYDRREWEGERGPLAGS